MQFCTHRDDRWGRADRRASRVVALMRSIIPIGTMEASEAASAGSVIRLDLSRTSTACGLTITRSTWRLIRPRSAAAPGSSVVSMCLRTPSRERRLRPRPTQQRSVRSANPVLSGSSYCWFPAEPSIKRCTRTPAHMGGSPRRYQPGSASRAGNGPLAENGPAQVSETAATWWKVSRPRIPFPRSK